MLQGWKAHELVPGALARGPWVLGGDNKQGPLVHPASALALAEPKAETEIAMAMAPVRGLRLWGIGLLASIKPPAGYRRTPCGGAAGAPAWAACPARRDLRICIREASISLASMTSSESSAGAPAGTAQGSPGVSEDRGGNAMWPCDCLGDGAACEGAGAGAGAGSDDALRYVPWTGPLGAGAPASAPFK